MDDGSSARIRPGPRATPSPHDAVLPSRLPQVRTPPALTWLVEALGADDALRLIEARGGTEFWAPSGINNSSAKLREDLEAEFGIPMTKALIRHFGGFKIKVPLALKWRTQLYDAHGMTHNQIARKLVCSSDTICRRLQAVSRPDSGKSPRVLVAFSASARASRPFNRKERT